MPNHLTEQDYMLSMLLSPRARNPENNEELRTVIVHRLTDTFKASARMSIRKGLVSVLCEPCKAWTSLDSESFPGEQWQCPKCQRIYAMELAIFEEINDPGGEAKEASDE